MSHSTHKTKVLSTQPWLQVLAVLLIALAATSQAQASSLIYEARMPADQAGIVPHAVLVGFNPQPEPPARLLIAGDLSSENPSVVFTGVEGEPLEILLGVGGGQSRLAEMSLVGTSCGARYDIKLYPSFRDTVIPDQCRGNFQVRARFMDRSELRLDVTMRAVIGDEIVPPGTLVGFNPQPEPPALPAFGLRVDLRDLGADTLTVDVALSDRFGNSILLR